ncbi:MAG: UDP-N-acetylmuramate dehydrogenase [Candidatus Paceibacterota bacterium]
MTINIKENEELSLHTTFKAGGQALFFVEVFSTEELVSAVAYADKKNLEIVALGGGSNTLFKDGLHNKIVIKISIKGIEETDVGDNVELKVGAGVPWDSLVSFSTKKGLWGLENLSSIPGLVGGACVQNIGAYGAELKDTIKEVFVYDFQNKDFKKIPKEECEYGYRESIFTHRPSLESSEHGGQENKKRYLIVQATFLLKKIPDPKVGYKDLRNFFGEKIPQTSEEVREAIISIREKKFPDLKKYGTAGSFFKNPVVDMDTYERLQKEYPEMPAHAYDSKMKLSTAWILDRVLNLKGYTEGSVSLWIDQPLVLVNSGSKKAEDIILFYKKIKKMVFEKTGIELEEEVVII